MFVFVIGKINFDGFDYHVTLKQMQYLYVAYVRHVAHAVYFAYATPVFRICNICRICNMCTSLMQHISHMQHIFTRSDFFQKVPDEIFFNGWALIRAPVDCVKLKRNFQLSKNRPGGSQDSW